MGERAAGSDLGQELRQEPPDSILQLSEADQERLLEYFRSALNQQREALKDAADSGMNQIPALLRGAVRRILGL